APAGPDPGLHLDRAPVAAESHLDLDVLEGDGVAEWNQIRGPLGGADPGDPCEGDGVPLRHSPAADRAERRPAHADRSLRHRLPPPAARPPGGVRTPPPGIS